MSIPDDAMTYSISLRLRRTTIDYAYISVPVTGDVVKRDAQGVGRLDVVELTRLALEMGKDPGVTWYQEEQTAEPHPVQKARDPGESGFPS